MFEPGSQRRQESDTVLISTCIRHRNLEIHLSRFLLLKVILTNVATRNVTM